ncbi:hypothetical protein IMG5_202740 [Ichthyophthirius multifiliis]|uniref:Tetratricopeptide repeat protein n=1 Tax=Ichthyophthirius multifiliis TaxID=5932 RepID=G0R672_ICHMU|nr:hypothetical protein IMG5_202740 [Ichthyophthirius multifiliis]EGR27036.1 hypothetical protein IMG5_202740 [Ichthyophthirius multifiliis]|eukprot:XP_004023920.1 hypothetical protein IMG5_202740 [Ichthyophthirius multifiliis]
MSDEESSDGEEQINLEQIKYNSLIIEAYNSFQKRDLKQAIEYYNKALLDLEHYQDFDRIALVQANLAVIYFHSCQYKQSEQLLKKSLQTLEKVNQISEHRNALYVKIYANLCVVYIILNRYDEAQQSNEQAINIIINSQDKQKKDLLEELVYLYFRFISFKNMGDGQFDNLESKYQGATLACFYSSMALNRELCNDLVGAVNYHQKALKVWEQVNDQGFIIISLKHLIYLLQNLNESQNNIIQYQNMLNYYLQTDEFKGINPETLFKDFENKINCAKQVNIKKIFIQINIYYVYFKKKKKQITNSVKRLENGLNDQILNISSNSLLKQNNAEVLNDFGENFWKQALRLRLTSSIRYSQQIIQGKKLDQEQKQALQIGLDQMKQTIIMLKQEKHPLVEKQLINMPFTQQAVSNLKASISKLNKMILKFIFLDAFDKLQMNAVNKSRLSAVNRQQKKINNIIENAYKYTMVGDYLLKCNKTSNGRLQKFFKLAQDCTLRWTAREKNINNKSKVQFYHMQEVRGVVYGKVTDVMCKPYNKKLQSWLCFSLILKSRSLDFFCEPDQINKWLIALGSETKKFNPGSYALRPAQVYWRKMKLILYYYFVEPHLQKGKTFYHSFVKVIIAFGRNQYKLPIINNTK